MAATLESLKLYDYSDRELLWIVHDNMDDDGWAVTADVAKAVGLTGGRANSSAGIRLAWLKRYGVLDNKKTHAGTLWTLTPIGEVMMRGELTVRQEQVLEGFRPEQMILVSRAVGKKYVGAKAEAASLIGRELRRGMMLR